MTGTRDTKKVTAGQAQIWKDEWGIFHIEIAHGAYIQLADVQQHREAILSISTQKKDIAVLLKGTYLKGFSPEARNYVSTPEMADIHRACAAIVTNRLHQVIASFFLGINKPPFPFKVFTKEEEAIQWLLAIK